MQNKKYRAAIHTVPAGKYYLHYIVYGSNPFGPRGGSCGNYLNGHEVSPVVASTTAPVWMKKAAEQLEAMQVEPERVKVRHQPYTRKFEFEIEH